MNKVFSEIYKAVWDEIFPGFEQIEIEKFRKIFTSDFILPQKYQCAFSGEDVYCTSDYGYKRFVGDKERAKRMDLDNHMEPKSNVNSLAEALGKVSKIAYFRGSKIVNSDVVEASDNIYSSSYIYNSSSIHGAQKIMFSYDMAPCEYMIASRNCKDCSFGIRVMDSSEIYSSFDISFSGKCSHCYFCHNCYDLKDCMFCFHIESKQYCIANMQFTEEEYNRLRPIILKEYFDQIGSEDRFALLRDI